MIIKKKIIHNKYKINKMKINIKTQNKVIVRNNLKI